MTKPSNVHLVGSVPLANSAEVFSQVCGALGSHLRRISDGETGERGGWIAFQRAMLAKHPAVVINPDGRKLPVRDLLGKVSRENPLLALNSAIPVDEIEFRPLGYLEAALDSWPQFQQMQRDGVIPADLRFQVSLPTPFATGLLYFHPDWQVQYIDLMKSALLREALEICSVIPHDKLAIQWDCCQEILLLEGYFPDDWAYDAELMAATVAELGNALPAKVELGYHLCYGSPVDSPLVAQHDMGVAVNFCNQIAAQLTHSLDFVHIPVSVPDADDDFFRPLQTLSVPAETAVYLGILHPKVAGGDAARIARAQQFLPSFGVATECGWGRKSAETINHLLQVHRAAVTN